jgi:hypothetical protein
MSKSLIKAGLVAAVAAIGAGAFAASALAGPTGTTNANTASPNTTKVAPNFQVAGHTSEMSFVPVNPCKLVDTRLAGGQFGNGTSRAYHARGTGSLASQGGSSTGCALPANAAAISTIVSAVSPSADGFIQTNASDQASAGATSVNYSAGVSISSSATINLSAPAAATAFKVKNNGGPTHISISVVGYYIAPMGAEVNSVGTLVVGNRVTLARVIPGFPGQYEVIFDRDVTKCYYSATAFSGSLQGEVEPRSGNPNGVFVAFTNNSGTITATQFYLTVSC